MKLSPQESSTDQSRRRFVQRLSLAPLAAMAFQSFGSVSRPPSGPISVLDESYWQGLKKQFPVPSNLAMFNAANLCPTPNFVNEKVVAAAKELAGNVSFQHRAIFASQRAKTLVKLSQFVGASGEEIGITRNTSEGNCILVNGLDLKPNDEIIIWDQNHPSNNVAWETRARRSGFIVKKVTVPVAPRSKEELIDSFVNAISSKTRLIAFSHVSNVTGIALPAKEICAIAKSKGILTLVDGAQTLGLIDLDLHDLGCDFFTASTHKWLMGPLENGLLYVNTPQIESLWPGVTGAGWKTEGHSVDEKLCVLGQRIETTTYALPEIIDFHLSITKKIMEERVRMLSTYLKEQIRLKIPQSTFATPADPGLSAGIVVVNFPGKDPKEIYQKLYEQFGIACAATVGVRFSPHIYNTLGDIDKVVKALSTLA